jgi:putative SOS response-associated peptidase YedK
MCGRYSLAPDEFSQIQLEFRVEAKLELARRYNIAPTWAPGYEPPIVFTNGDGGVELGLARWWMIPASWARPLEALPTSFNARAEELDRRRFWKQSFESRRCLVPATGWREFRGEKGHRDAFQFHYDHALFAFAGVWDVWKSPGGDEVRSFAIVTVAATEMVRPIHDRMPLVVNPQFYEAWLDPRLPGGQALATVLGAGTQEPSFYQADPRGNDVRREGPECIAKAPAKQIGLF